ncbi:MAG: DNA repair protein RecO [Acidobacteriota bacterium]|nr:DNA repair protein RecO [Acidobacteriota bacterium]
MPLLETEAIVLRTYRLGEADKIVSLFSRQLGRIRAVAQGALRAKSRFGGVLEPLTYARVSLFERENRNLARINSAELVESFFAMQSDYAVHLAAQFVAEASEQLLPEREANERVFRLLIAVLRGLKTRRGSVEAPLAYFDFWLLLLSGFLPPLDRCGACGRALGSDGAWYGRGSLRMVCSRCRTPGEDLRIGAPPLAAAGGMRRLPLEKWMAEAGPQESVREMRLLFESWVEAAAEKKFATRALLAEQP